MAAQMGHNENRKIKTETFPSKARHDPTTTRLRAKTNMKRAKQIKEVTMHSPTPGIRTQDTQWPSSAQHNAI